MVRSLRATPSFVAAFFALALVGFGCGGSSTPPSQQQDGGTTDGPRVQFDSGTVVQRDASTALDGGGGTECNPSGGQPAGGLCKFESDCQCPNSCLNLFGDPSITVSCWEPCGQTECSNAADLCVGDATAAGCLPVGTVSGTFTDIPMYLDSESPEGLGTANITLAVGDINVTFTTGFGIKSSTGNYYFLFLMPGTVEAPDITKNLVIAISATSYAVKTWDIETDTNVQIDYELLGLAGQAISSDTMMAVALSGTLELTAAGTGGGAVVTGSITGTAPDPMVVKYVAEFCGPNSTPC